MTYDHSLRCPYSPSSSSSTTHNFTFPSVLYRVVLYLVCPHPLLHLAAAPSSLSIGRSMITLLVRGKIEFFARVYQIPSIRSDPCQVHFSTSPSLIPFELFAFSTRFSRLLLTLCRSSSAVDVDMMGWIRRPDARGTGLLTSTILFYASAYHTYVRSYTHGLRFFPSSLFVCFCKNNRYGY